MAFVNNRDLVRHACANSGVMLLTGGERNLIEILAVNDVEVSVSLECQWTANAKRAASPIYKISIKKNLPALHSSAERRLHRQGAFILQTGVVVRASQCPPFLCVL